MNQKRLFDSSFILRPSSFSWPGRGPRRGRHRAMNATPQILLIDDNRAWLETLSEYLRDRGFAVRTADRPSRGLAILEKDDVRVVILDFELPEMDGLELLRQIRRRRPVPVLLLSG